VHAYTVRLRRIEAFLALGIDALKQSNQLQAALDEIGTR